MVGTCFDLKSKCFLSFVLRNKQHLPKPCHFLPRLYDQVIPPNTVSFPSSSVSLGHTSQHHVISFLLCLTRSYLPIPCHFLPCLSDRVIVNLYKVNGAHTRRSTLISRFTLEARDLTRVRQPGEGTGSFIAWVRFRLVFHA